MGTAVTQDAPEGRRECLKRLAIGLAVAPWIVATPRARAAVPRSIAFQHTHTGESLSRVYAVGDDYLPDALRAVNHLLRDHRANLIYPIDPALLDQLHSLAAVTGTSQPFQVICGYRSEATNEMLRARSRGVAQHSLHPLGQAIDIRLADIPLPDLRDAALSLKAGGVGYYAGSNFIHVDTGRVRRW
ncbi:MAG TPA: DUF882 domain-containing protein [Burkholderiales bacterium]|nr:DUF882 domain-containing protein [Burkholderiales bacterium]